MIEMNELQQEMLQELIAQRQIKRIREIFEEFNIIDLAELVESLELEEILFLFKTLKKEITADIFTYLTNQKKEEIVQKFTGPEITSMLDNLYADDIVDFLEEMPANVVKHVLDAATSAQRAEINQLLSYPDSSAGSIMSTDFVELESSDSVSTAIGKLKVQGRKAETISVSYVINAKRVLVGSVILRDIMLADPEDKIEQIMDSDIISVTTHDDQEEVARVISKYDINVIPVVNDENRLIGIITVDDIMDIMEEEVTEDIQKMAAIIPTEGSYLTMTIQEMTKSRIVWLLLLMISATFTGLIIEGYEAQLLVIPALAGAIPMIMSTAGNAGSQASTMVIRGIAVDDLTYKDYIKVLWKELQVALISGVVLFGANWIRLWIFKPNTGWQIDLVISMTLLLTVIVAKMVGGLLPLIAMFFKQDPAAMAAPIITTIVDAVALIIYFNLAVAILGI